MKKKAYVITETNFEYNDETYFCNDRSLGKPVEVWGSREEAQDQLDALNAASLRVWNPLEMCYELEEISPLGSVKELMAKLSEIFDADFIMDSHDCYDSTWEINCRGKEHRLYTVIGEKCPCQPVQSDNRWDQSVWPQGATDEQLVRAIDECFPDLAPFHTIHEISLFS